MFAENPFLLQEVMIRLGQRLTQIYPLEVRGFAGAAAQHMRAMLVELAQDTATDSASDELREWVRMHKSVEKLSDDERELFDLVLYWGMKPAKVAALLGISLDGVRLCWNEARLALEEVRRQDRVARASGWGL
jgi:DNA-directed RNA polymerase specialized sigma24 family protein